jgi:hypothetical protein
MLALRTRETRGGVQARKVGRRPAMRGWRAGRSTGRLDAHRSVNRAVEVVMLYLLHLLFRKLRCGISFVQVRSILIYEI